MQRFVHLALATLATLGVLAAPVQAGNVVVMTPTTVNSALAQLRPGDTLRLEGAFTSLLRLSNRDFGGVVVDGRAAQLHQGMQVRNVHNITFNDLSIGQAGVQTLSRFSVNMQDSSHVSFARGNWFGLPTAQGAGLRILNSQFITVRDSHFDGLHDNIHFLSSTDGLLTRNTFNRSGSDGIKIVNSRRVIASANSCLNGSPAPGAHADCIQFWSTSGLPPQSDIYLLNNYLLGHSQGFVSFASAVPQERITFAGNYVATTYPQGMYCWCNNSRFEDNVVVALPDAQHRSNFRVIGDQNMITTNNLVYDLRGVSGPLEDLLPERLWSNLVPSIAWNAGSAFDERSWQPTLQLAASQSASNAPEPATWLMLATGFLAVGRMLRRQRSLRVRRVLA